MKELTVYMIIAVAFLLAVGGCSRSPEQTQAEDRRPTLEAGEASEAPSSRVAEVVDVKLGRYVAPDYTIGGFTGVFGLSDAVFAEVIVANGQSDAAVSVRVSVVGDGVVLFEELRKAEGARGQTLNFTIANPASYLFKQGSYRLEVSLDGEVATIKEFSVL